MPEPRFSAGYLTEIEASHLTTQSIPAGVVVHLRRELPGETAQGRPVRRMFVELTISEAVEFWRNLGETIRAAGAKGQQASHVDAVTSL